MATVRSATVYGPSSLAAGVRHGAGAPSKLRHPYTDWWQRTEAVAAHSKDTTRLLYTLLAKIKV